MTVIRAYRGRASEPVLVLVAFAAEALGLKPPSQDRGAA